MSYYMPDKKEFRVRQDVSQYLRDDYQVIMSHLKEQAKHLFIDEVWKRTKHEMKVNSANYYSLDHKFTVEYTPTAMNTYNNKWTDCGCGTSSTVNNWDTSTITMKSHGTLQDYIVGANYKLHCDPPNEIQLTPGAKTISLPDGTKIEMDDNGNYKIIDKDAKVTYTANRNRDFNPFLNANDLLGEYIDALIDLGVDALGILRSPIELFMTWLINKAAEADGDELPPGAVKLEDHPLLEQVLTGKIMFLPAKKLLLAPPQMKWSERCKWCGRFITSQKCECQIFFCDPEHMTRFAEKHAVNF